VCQNSLPQLLDLEAFVMQTLPSLDLSIQAVECMKVLNKMLLETLDLNCMNLIYNINDTLLKLIYKTLNKNVEKPYGLPRNTSNLFQITR
jgi:hypothetical protein